MLEALALLLSSLDYREDILNFDTLTTSISEGGAISAIFALCATLLLTFLVMLGVKALSGIAQQATKRTKTTWDDYLPVIFENLRSWVVAIWIFGLVASSLNFHGSIYSAMRTLTIAATTYQVIVWAVQVMRAWRDRKMAASAMVDEQAPIGLLTTVAETVVVIILVMAGLSNLGVDIGALIAGLGIGGIAVALAAQNILGDLFASFSIIFDKPFRVGDFIKVGEDSGTVSAIGLKTTRVKSLTGEQLIFSNKDLLESRIRNFKRMNERRVVHKFRVPFNTAIQKMRQVPRIVENVLKDYPHTRFDYCKLTEMTEYAFSFEAVYWVDNPDNTLHLGIQEKFILGVVEGLRHDEMNLAVPAQYQWVDDVNADEGDEPQARKSPVTDNGLAQNRDLQGWRGAPTE